MDKLLINSERSKEVAIILFDKFNSNEGIFGHAVMPEDILPLWNSDLHSLGIGKGSYEHLMFITLVVSIDFTFRPPPKKHNLIFLFIQFFANFTHYFQSNTPQACCGDE